MVLVQVDGESKVYEVEWRWLSKYSSAYIWYVCNNTKNITHD